MLNNVKTDSSDSEELEAGHEGLRPILDLLLEDSKMYTPGRG